MMLEQVSLLSNGDFQQSTMLQLHLHCVDRTAESTTAFVSIRDRPMHSEDNQTLNLRAVDPIVDDSIWAYIDDGCNSCCHGEVWRQNAEVKMKVVGLHPFFFAQEGDYFQRRRNGHNERKAENSCGRHSVCCILVLVCCAVGR